MFNFDPKTMSNDELFNKQLDLVGKKLQAARFGKVDAANQMQTMINAIDAERQERLYVERIGSYMRATAGVVIESDPVLRAKDMAEEEKVAEATPKPKPEIKTRVPVRTAKPVIPDGGKI